jgi:hypothetical protein
LWLWSDHAHNQLYSANFLDGLAFVALYAAFVGPAISLTMGAALHAFLVDAKATSLTPYLIAGMAPGALLLLVGAIQGEPNLIAWMMAMSGACSAGLFWLIRRPDRG